MGPPIRWTGPMLLPRDAGARPRPVRLVPMGGTLAAALFLALMAGDPPPGKGRPDPLAGKVREAVAKGVAWIRKQQDPDGHFRGFNGVSDDPDIEVRKIYMGHRAGETALALHTLRSCGVPADDGAVAAGFAYLREAYR